MIILAFYICPSATNVWLDTFVRHLENLKMTEQNILPIFLPNADIKEGSCKVECIYPRFAFEYEEKEAIGIQEVINKLEERIRMTIN